MSLTRVDHVMICVPDLGRGADAYRRLGFDIQPGGVHPGVGTHNAIGFFESDYLELLALRDKAEYLKRSPFGELIDFIGHGGGLRYVIAQSDDLAADVAAMRARGVEVSDVSEGARRTPAGLELRWKLATLGRRNALPLFFVQHLTPIEERRRQPGAGRHPNGVFRIERAYVAVADLAASARLYEQVLGVAPRLERGTVIMAEMAVFQLGESAVTLAHPTGPGVTADALARRGPGPFQVLYRTKSMDAAAKWMSEHGLPPPARGIRNTGEQAMLVSPAQACGAYVGFVGPA